MNKLDDLYNFIDFAKGNRKYPENTANGLKSALKIFEKDLNIDELNSVDLIEENIEEIFIGVVNRNKDKSIGSLNTYKARVLKVINDYQRYGINPSKIQGWTVKPQKIPNQTKNLPALLRKALQAGDNPDKNEDSTQIASSEHINTPVHKIEVCLKDNLKATIIIPKNINIKEAEMIKKIIDSMIID
jgi:hypothetical protein